MSTEAAAEVIETKPKKGRKSTKKVEQNEEVLAVVKAAEDDAAQGLAVVSDFAIESQDDMDACGELKRDYRDKREGLEARLKEITAPLRAAEKSARDLFRPAIGLCQQIEHLCTEAIRSFELKKLQAAREARQAVEASGGQADEKTLMVAHGHGAVALAGEVSARRVFKFEVTDPAAIPERFWMRVLNEKAIADEVDANGGKTVIPGVRVYEDIDIRNKARRG